MAWHRTEALPKGVAGRLVCALRRDQNWRSVLYAAWNIDSLHNCRKLKERFECTDDMRKIADAHQIARLVKATRLCTHGKVAMSAIVYASPMIQERPARRPLSTLSTLSKRRDSATPSEAGAPVSQRPGVTSGA